MPVPRHQAEQLGHAAPTGHADKAEPGALRFSRRDAAMLHASIQKILAMPPETRIFVGRDYLPAGRSDYACETSVAAQKAGNIHVHDGVSADDFIAMRRARNATLAPPLLILPSLQVNIAAGELPPAHAKGRRFLRLPLRVV
jgi:hypothetical protein